MSAFSKIVFAGSAALVVVAGIGWQSEASVPPRSDLVGAPVVASMLSSTSTATSTNDATNAAGNSASSESTGSSEQTSSEIDFEKLLASSFREAARTSDAANAKVFGPRFVGPAPARIAISSLKVDAPVISVGLKPDKSMEIPGAEEAGWFMLGARPGDEFGSAVLAGHVDHDRKPGVFLELRRLNVGASISVTDTSGNELRYEVTERFQVDKDDLPTRELFRRDGPPVLTLITCGGEFDRKGKTYVDNIVIRAVPVILRTAR
jgi:LPXTG-site transpeptidase (sortase) family protein